MKIIFAGVFMAEIAEGEKKFDFIGSLKPGNYVLIDGSVCQIKGIEKSKPGKHGAAKARITAFDIFTGSKKTLLKPTSADAEIPIIIKGNAQIVAVMGDNVQIMDLGSYEIANVKKPSDIPGLISGIEVEYVKYGPNVKILHKKSA